MFLQMAVNGEYFREIKARTKLEEYRLVNEYWTRRLEGKEYDLVIITHGYPKRDDMDKREVFHWQGYEKKTITHKHFGPDPVEVFAIQLTAPF